MENGRDAPRASGSTAMFHPISNAIKLKTTKIFQEAKDDD
jgi:hypothetical protein